MGRLACALLLFGAAFGNWTETFNYNEKMEWNFVPAWQSQPDVASDYVWKAVGFAGDRATDDEFVLFSGKDASNNLLYNSVWLYNITSNTWRLPFVPLEGRPSPREKAAGVVCGEYLYVYGGKDGSDWVYDLWRFDLKYNLWERIEVIFPSQSHLRLALRFPGVTVPHAVCRNGNEIWVSGAKQDGGHVFLRFDLATVSFANSGASFIIPEFTTPALEAGGKPTKPSAFYHTVLDPNQKNIHMWYEGNSVFTFTILANNTLVRSVHTSPERWKNVTQNEWNPDGITSSLGCFFGLPSGDLFQIGGWSDENGTFVAEQYVWQYLAANQTWISKPSVDMPGRSNMHCVGWKDKVVTSHGWADKITNDLHVYDVPTGVTKRMLDRMRFPSGRGDHCAAVVGDHMIVFGGKNHRGQLLSETWSLNLNTHVWQLLEPTNNPPPRHAHTCNANGDLILMFGGLDQNGEAMGDLWRFSRALNNWRQLERDKESDPWPGRRYHHSAWLVASSDNSNLFMYGGSNVGEELDDLWRYNLFFGYWEEVPLAVSAGPLENAAGALVNNHLLVLTGGASNSINSLLTWTFDTLNLPAVIKDHESFKWTKQDDYGPSFVNAFGIAGGRAVGAGDQVLLVGGGSYGYITGNIYHYNVDLNAWNSIGGTKITPQARIGHSLVYYRDTVFVFGGFGAGDSGTIDESYALENTLSMRLPAAECFVGRQAVGDGTTDGQRVVANRPGYVRQSYTLNSRIVYDVAYGETKAEADAVPANEVDIAVPWSDTWVDNSGASDGDYDDLDNKPAPDLLVWTRRVALILEVLPNGFYKLLPDSTAKGVTQIVHKKWLIHEPGCWKCARGAKYFSPTGQCVPCAKGQYDDPAQEVCQECDAGYYGPFTSATTKQQCLPCTLGGYCNTTGLSKPFPCEDWEFCPSGSLRPLPGKSNFTPSVCENSISPGNCTLRPNQLETFDSQMDALTVSLGIVAFVFLAVLVLIAGFVVPRVGFNHFVWLDQMEEEEENKSLFGGVFTILFFALFLCLFAATLIPFIENNLQEQTTLLPKWEPTKMSVNMTLKVFFDLSLGSCTKADTVVSQVDLQLPDGATMSDFLEVSQVGQNCSVVWQCQGCAFDVTTVIVVTLKDDASLKGASKIEWDFMTGAAYPEQTSQAHNTKFADVNKGLLFRGTPSTVVLSAVPAFFHTGFNATEIDGYYLIEEPPVDVVPGQEVSGALFTEARDVAIRFQIHTQPNMIDIEIDTIMPLGTLIALILAYYIGYIELTKGMHDSMRSLVDMVRAKMGSNDESNETEMKEKEANVEDINVEDGVPTAKVVDEGDDEQQHGGSEKGSAHQEEDDDHVSTADLAWTTWGFLYNSLLLILPLLFVFKLVVGDG